MEEQRSAGGAERQVTELIKDDEAGIGEPPGDLPRLSLKLLLFEGVVNGAGNFLKSGAAKFPSPAGLGDQPMA